MSRAKVNVNSSVPEIPTIGRVLFLPNREIPLVYTLPPD